MSGFQVEVLRRPEELRALAPAWRELLARCPAGTPFQSPDWLIPWFETFAPGDLATVAVSRDGGLVALAPLYRETGPLGRRLLPLGISLSDYLDVLIDPGAPRAGEALVDALAALGLDWDSLSLEELRPEAAGLTLPAGSMRDDGAAAQSACPVLPLRGTLAETLPARKLRKLRMARNRADRRGDAVIEAVAIDGAGAFLDELFRLHALRWRERGEPGVLADEKVQRFHRRALPGLIGAGLARALVARFGNEVGGAYYGFADHDRAYAYLGGFDPAFAYESPGTLLVGHAIEDAVSAGCTEFHFLRGQEAYKYEWGAVDRWNQRWTLRPGEALRASA
ncbi:MAG TPA: GNAT family N-acetyltransferase [Beijerinckiaceae bacterium]